MKRRSIKYDAWVLLSVVEVERRSMTGDSMKIEMAMSRPTPASPFSSPGRREIKPLVIGPSRDMKIHETARGTKNLRMRAWSSAGVVGATGVSDKAIRWYRYGSGAAES